MGKWTPNYTDDVLQAKISTLVSGAIRRAAIEKETGTFMTYENFVNDLDTGDSFTTSLIDILVREVADRRTRTAGERRLITERTMKNLRLLSNSHRVVLPSHNASRTHARRTVNLAEYLTAPPNELEMEEDDDEFDGLMETGGTLEGARVNTDLYDAYTVGGPPWPPSNARRITASPSPVPDEWHPPPLRSPTAATRPWSSLASTSVSAPSLLSRQASIRRAARSRVDFNEYSQRRRSTMRDSLASRPDAAETVTEPRDNLTRSSSSTQPGRRFFPFPRTRRPELSTNLTWAQVSDTLSPDADESIQFVPHEHDHSGGTWLEAASLFDHRSASPEAETQGDAETLVIRAPRLRRGGVRAPESMLSRHASPVIITAEHPAPPPPAALPEETTAPASEEPVAYPTPGSTENENLA